MTIIALPHKAGKIKRLLGEKIAWYYLGKDVFRRERIARILGEENKVSLRASLHNITRDFSQPYISFVAEWGRNQQDRLNWWAGKFASKSHMQSDFFLLFCYKVLTLRLVEEAAERNRVIFIEDPWLFLDLKKDCADKGKTAFSGRPALAQIKLFCLVRGVICRLGFCLWSVWARWVMFCHYGASSGREEKRTAIINPAEKRAFREGRYVDNYMPGFKELLAENGVNFVYLYLVRYPLSTAKDAGKNKQILWPLIYNVKLPALLKRMLQYWQPAGDRKVSRRIGSYDVSVLLQREWWLELASAGFNVHLTLFDALDDFFQKRQCGSVIYVFENQPWEKMVCLAAAKNGVKTTGYQSSSIWKLFLSQFIAEDERSFIPLPDKIVTAGSYFAQLYKEGNIPGNKLFVGGTWRYPQMPNELKSDMLKDKAPRSVPVVLIPLCFDMAISTAMLQQIIKTISKNGLSEKMQFWVKPHPGNTRYELNRLSKFLSDFHLVGEPFTNLLKDVDVVIASTSTIGLEAYLCGKRVVSFIPENLLAADPLLDVSDDDENIYKWYEGEKIDMDFLQRASSPVNIEKLNRLRKRYFSPIDYKLWLESV